VRRIGLVVVSFAVTAVLVGCGHGSDASGTKVLAAVPEAMKDAGSARIKVSASTGDPNATSDAATGVVDFDRDVSHMGAGENEELMVGGKIYSRLPYGLPSLAGKKWVVDDVPKLKTDHPMTASPARALDVLRTHSTDFRRIGQESLAGTATDHYRGQLTETLGSGSKETIDIWVDRAGLARRIRDLVEEPARPAGCAGVGPTPATSVAFTFEYSDFGIDVNVAAPPADEVVTRDEFTKATESLNHPSPFLKLYPSDRSCPTP
jgi:hypothetical protein